MQATVQNPFPPATDGHGIVIAEANRLAPLEDSAMSRRRFQRGSVFLRGKREQVWVGRWREDVINQDQKIHRICRKEVLGTKKEFPTKKLALRELSIRLAPVNSTSYRALRTATFAQFVAIWDEKVLSQKRPSTQSAIRSAIRNWLTPYFGDYAMKDINGLTVQMFVRSCKRSPKTILNLILSLRMIWNTAKAWQYVMHDPFVGVTLPEITQQRRFFFTQEEARRIITNAHEPYGTLYWLAAEGGLRAGELAGLRVADLDLHNGVVNVRQSAWSRQIQPPKTPNAIRQFAISPQLVTKLRTFLETWRPNSLGLLFATRGGRPITPSQVMRTNLHPLLDSLGIRRCGLHAFRHTNSSLMDRLNTPMKVRQERLGHALGSDITMNVYTHAVSEDDRKIASQLGDILCPDVSKFVMAQPAGNA
jgi:integrase